MRVRSSFALPPERHAGGRFDAQVCEGELLVLLGAVLRHRLRPTNAGPDSREQLFEREGLDEVVVGAGVEPCDAIGERVLRGQHQH